MAQDGVAEPGQLGCRVVEKDRLVGDVGRGHDQRLGHPFDQQAVERRVGEHEADAVLPRRRQARQAVARPGLEQDDGATRGSAAIPSPAADTRQCLRIMAIVAIRAKGLRSRPLKRRSRSRAFGSPAGRPGESRRSP